MAAFGAVECQHRDAGLRAIDGSAGCSPAAGPDLGRRRRVRSCIVFSSNGLAQDYCRQAPGVILHNLLELRAMRLHDVDILLMSTFGVALIASVSR